MTLTNKSNECITLQSQLEERDRLVRVLQQQMLRMAENHEPRTDDTCNVATQTDRVRIKMNAFYLNKQHT